MLIPITDTMIDDELGAAEHEAGVSRSALRLRRLERRARRPTASEREQLLVELESLAHAAANEGLAATERA